jgi:hypothetical protein
MFATPGPPAKFVQPAQAPDDHSHWQKIRNALYFEQNWFRRRPIMKSITIHGIETDLDKKIAQKASEIGLSQNRTVKLFLKSTLNSEKKGLKKESFPELFRKWTILEKKILKTH